MYIYTNETCPYCKSIKEELDKNNIEFNERLIKDYQKNWQQIYSLTGMPTVPTIEYNGEYFVPGRDFANASQLINILQNFSKIDFSDSRRSLEKIKTLNYYTNQAFVKLDQLLRQIENQLNTEKDEHESTN